MTENRLKQQLDFIVETDRLKQILRQTLVIDDQRQENDAEHSWHLALMTLLLSEYANDEGIDVLKVMKMVVIHDLVEIYAGDTFCYDYEGAKDKKEREYAAARKIFGLLPEGQGKELLALWEEFEETTSAEANFAAALDRLQPLLLNFNTDGAAWKKHGITKSQVIERNHHISKGSEILWKFAEWLIEESVRRNYLVDG
ncbi:MAG: HD domain-containing protein [Candidatus Thorarchaeota archaeon]